MILRLLCLSLHLCSLPSVVTQSAPLPAPLTLAQRARDAGFEAPTDFEPDGHIPIEYIFRYDEDGKLRDPWWWRYDWSPAYRETTRIRLNK